MWLNPRPREHGVYEKMTFGLCWGIAFAVSCFDMAKLPSDPVVMGCDGKQILS